MIIKAATWALLLATAQAQAITFLNEIPGVLELGVPFTLRWSGSQGLVTIKLFQGSSFALGDIPILVLIEGLQGQSYTWTPPTSLDPDWYGVHLNDAINTAVYFLSISESPAATTLSGSSPVQTASSTTSTGTEGGSTTRTAGPAEATAPSDSSTGTPPAASNSSGLSTAATAAIAALSSVIGVGLLGLVAYCAVVRRRKHRNGENDVGAVSGGDDVPSWDAVGIYTEGTDTPSKGVKVEELHGNGRAELPTGAVWDRAAELSAEGRYLK